MGELPAHLGLLPPEWAVVAVCRSGNRQRPGDAGAAAAGPDGALSLQARRDPGVDERWRGRFALNGDLLTAAGNPQGIPLPPR